MTLFETFVDTCIAHLRIYRIMHTFLANGYNVYQLQQLSALFTPTCNAQDLNSHICSLLFHADMSDSINNRLIDQVLPRFFQFVSRFLSILNELFQTKKIILHTFDQIGTY